MESPTNPLMKVSDIRAIADIAKKRSVLLAVDNTFLTPYFQRPLSLGADIALYSLTKYMNGHSDVIMGSLITNNEALYKQLQFLQNGKFEVFITLRIVLLLEKCTTFHAAPLIKQLK